MITMKRLSLKHCKNCNKLFKPKRSQQSFCWKGCATSFRFKDEKWKREYGKKMSKVMKGKIKGKKRPIEVREKIGLGHLGLKHSKKTIQKIKKSLLKRYGRKNKKLDRRSKKYSHWQKAVFQRDNWTCQTCGKRGKRLNAHHIKGWKENRLKRFVIKNGRTLCVSCHKKIHNDK